MSDATSISDEAKVIGTIILQKRSRAAIFDRLTPAHFSSQAGRRMFDALAACWAGNIPIDSDATLQGIIRRGDLECDRFMQWGTSEHSAATWQESVEILDRLELSRQILSATQSAVSAALEPSFSRADLADAVHGVLGHLLNASIPSACETLGELQDSEEEAFRQIRAGNLKPVTWGVKSLDYMCPVYPGQMAIIGARPGMGKTAMQTTGVIAQLLKGTNVGVFTVEDDGEGVLCRIYSQLTGIPARDIKAGMIGFNQTALDGLAKARQYVRDNWAGRLFIMGGRKVGLDRICSESYAWVKDHGVGALWFDYLTDFEMPKGRELHERVEAMSHGIRNLTRKDSLHVPAYVLCQINRSGASGFPNIANLKGSGAIEQDAHVIVMIDRPETEPHTQRKYREGGADKDMTGKAAMIVGKNRNGPTGTVYVDYDGPTMRFSDENRRRTIDDSNTY